MNAVILSADIANFAINAIRLLIPIFCVSTMLAMGLDITYAETLVPLRNLLAVGIIVLVNNVFVPLVGFVILALPALLAGGLFGDLAGKLVPLVDRPEDRISPAAAVLREVSWGRRWPGFPARRLHLPRAPCSCWSSSPQCWCPSSWNCCVGFRASANRALSTARLRSGAVFTTLLLYQLLPLAVGIFVKTKYDAIAVRLRPLILILTGLAFLLLLVLDCPDRSGA